jgi:hypothetical protein
MQLTPQLSSFSYFPCTEKRRGHKMPPMRDVLIWGCVILSGTLVMTANTNAAENLWKAGVARSIITPTNSLWLGGYAGRKHPAEGTATDLWLKVLALEDAAGHRAVIITTDLLAIRAPLYRKCMPQLKEKFGLDPAQVLLTASHTHCGPVLPNRPGSLSSYTPEERAKLEQYASYLADKIVETTGRALAGLKPALLSASQSSAGFAANRRNDPELDRPRLLQEGKLAGPVEHSVSVLIVSAPDGKLVALLFGYACHNTTLTKAFCKYSADFAGFAKDELEKSHPGVTAMFFAGCAGDQDPVVRGGLELAGRYGNMLAAAVEESLLAPPVPLPPTLKTVMETIPLNLGAVPTKAELETLKGNPTNYVSRWAAKLLADLNEGKPIERTYPYPVQVWRFGQRQNLITLGGEPVVDYALKFKREFGSQTWVAGYANEVMSYIPTLRVLNEDKPPIASKWWGYEGSQAMMVLGLPAYRWGDDVEDEITTTVERLVKQAAAP